MKKFIPAIGKFFKGERKVFVVDLLKDLNFTLKSYIQGQVTVSIILGIIFIYRLYDYRITIYTFISIIRRS